MKKSGLSTIVSLGVAATAMGSLIWATHVWTAPIIEENVAAAASSGQFAVLPEADAFDVSALEWNGETFVYSRATNGAGFVFEVTGQAFGGPVSMLVGVDLEGQVQGVVVTDHNETPGLGSPAAEAPFLSQFAGNVLEGFTVVDSTAGPQEVEVLSGATITANTFTDTVNLAGNLFVLATGGVVEAPVAVDPLTVALPDALGEFEELPTHFVALNGTGYVVLVTVDGAIDEIQLLVGFTATGEVAGVAVQSHSETPGIGDKIEEIDFLGQFVGTNPESVDALSGATASGNSVAVGVRVAIDLFEELLGGGQ